MANGVVQKEVCVQWYQFVSRFVVPEGSGQHKNFTRMAPADFELPINLFGPKILKMDTRFRASVRVQERLIVTLRFLATGDSYTGLQ